MNRDIEWLMNDCCKRSLQDQYFRLTGKRIKVTNKMLDDYCKAAAEQERDDEIEAAIDLLERSGYSIKKPQTMTPLEEIQSLQERIKAASGRIDDIRSECEHDWVSTVAFANGRPCRSRDCVKCGAFGGVVQMSWYEYELKSQRALGYQS